MNWIDDVFKKKEEKPKGWYSVNDIKKQTGDNANTIRGRLLEMSKAGTLEVKKYLENGRLVNCYKKK